MMSIHEKSEKIGFLSLNFLQLMFDSLQAMMGMCSLMEGDNFPYKEEIRRVFHACIIQLHLVKHVEDGSPFGAFLTRKHWLCEEAERTYRLTEANELQSKNM